LGCGEGNKGFDYFICVKYPEIQKITLWFIDNAITQNEITVTKKIHKMYGLLK
jgi:hypothetical protein